MFLDTMKPRKQNKKIKFLRKKTVLIMWVQICGLIACSRLSKGPHCLGMTQQFGPVYCPVFMVPTVQGLARVWATRRGEITFRQTQQSQGLLGKHCYN